jgi:hypothetical protein
MVDNLKIEEISHGSLDLLDPRITEFHHFSAFETDQVIMLLVPI